MTKKFHNVYCVEYDLVAIFCSCSRPPLTKTSDDGKIINLGFLYQ